MLSRFVHIYENSNVYCYYHAIKNIPLYLSSEENTSFNQYLVDGVINRYYLEEEYMENDFTIGEFEEYIKEICYMLDIPNPVVLTKHIKNFILFNSTYFTEEDFVESINFERLVIEHGKGV